MEKQFETIIGMESTVDDGIEIELTNREDLITEIVELRKAIKSIHTDLIKFKNMKAFTGQMALTNFENKYIEDAVLVCENQLHVKYVKLINATAPTIEIN